MKLRGKIMTVLTLLAGGVAGVAYAQAGSSDTGVMQLLKARLPKTQVSKVDCGKIEGLCEVLAGDNLFYTDRSARYLVVGRVYDMETRQDLTAARLLEVNPAMLVGGAATGARAADKDADDDVAQGRAQVTHGSARAAAPGKGASPEPSKVSLAGLSSAGAVEWGRGGPTVTVFSDFRCGYCRMLHNDLAQMNVKVVERPISILGTRMLSNAVICSADRKRALARAYAGEDIQNAGNCDTSGLDANERFARGNGFTGTPVIVRADGAVIEGYRSREFLETWLKGGRS